jgi:hypothetical protein
MRPTDIMIPMRGGAILRCVLSLFVASLAIASDGFSASSKLLSLSSETGQDRVHIDAPKAAEASTVAGTTLVHFGQVDDGVYKGSKPRTDADYEFLQAHHVKYILDLELLPSMGHSERKKAKRYGIVLIHGRINASPISPSEDHIEKILAVLKNSRYHPVYFHCAYGRDRTSLVAALYKMYFMGMSGRDALQYMDESGYKDSWVRNGLKRYLKKHPSPPAAFRE